MGAGSHDGRRIIHIRHLREIYRQLVTFPNTYPHVKEADGYEVLLTIDSHPEWPTSESIRSYRP